MAPEGATLEYTDRYMRQVEALLADSGAGRAVYGDRVWGSAGRGA